MSRNNDGGPAFAVPAGTKDAYGNPTNQPQRGMSLRAYFAGQALVAMGTWSPGDAPDNPRYGSAEWHAWVHEARAKYAVAQADALLEALK